NVPGKHTCTPGSAIQMAIYSIAQHYLHCHVSRHESPLAAFGDKATISTPLVRVEGWMAVITLMAKERISTGAIIIAINITTARGGSEESAAPNCSEKQFNILMR